MLNSEGISVADALALRNTNEGFMGGNGAWWIIILILFFAVGGYGFGGRNTNTNSGAADNYVLASDFATLQRQLSDGFSGTEKGIDTIRNGLCDGFYTNAQLINGTNVNMLQGFNQLGSSIQAGIGTIREGIQANATQGVINTNELSRQLASCCCENEKMALQNRFDIQSTNCATLQAIDKMGDRIIDYLAADKAQTLRDENQALRLAVSQTAQNQYLINQLRPSPVPAYTVQNPYYTNGTGCGCF